MMLASLLALTLPTVTPASQDAPSLVVDLNDVGTPGSSEPWTGVQSASYTQDADFLSLPSGDVVFVASAPATGRELYRTDGLTVELVADVRVGPNGSDPRRLTVAGALVFFVADDGESGEELWASDGTAAGTVRLTDVTGDLVDTELLGIGSVVVFTSFQSDSGTELWRSDGTVEGTEMLVDLNPGPPSSGPSGFVTSEDGARVFFSAFTDSLSYAVWETDGTAAGTQLFGAPGSFVPRFLVPVGDRVFFERDGIGVPNQLWVCDGTTSGTIELQTGAELLHHGVFGGKLYFRGGDNNFPYELWRSDGTVAGTSAVDPSTTADFPAGFHELGDRLLLSRSTADVGAELWAMELDETLSLVLDIRPGPADGLDFDFFSADSAGGLLYFDGNDGESGNEVWVTDGTAAGTQLLVDLQPGPASSSPQTFTALSDGSMLWIAQEATVGQELWRYVPGGAPVALEADATVVTGGSDPGPFVRVGSQRFVFAALDDDLGREPFVWDPLAGVQLVGDLHSGPGSSEPEEFAAVWIDQQLQIVFSAAVPGLGREPWITPAAAPTSPVSLDLRPGPGSSDPAEFTAFGGRVFFTADDGVHGRELWVSDGTAAGTGLLVDLVPIGSQGSEPRELTVLADRLYFSARSTFGARALFVSDGSVAGTLEFASPEPLVDPESLFVYGDRMYFGDEDSALASTDGSFGGTWVAAAIDLGILADGGEPFFCGLGSHVYFSAQSSVGDVELYRTDGSVAGTGLFVELVPGSSGGRPKHLTASGDKLFFQAETASSGKELWVSDGTVAGTEQVLDLNPGFLDSHPRAFVPAAGGVYFSATTSEEGFELRFSDGTASGTQLVADLAPGSEWGLQTFFGEPTLVAGRLFLCASDGFTGFELFELASPGHHVFSIEAGAGGAVLEASSPKLGETLRIEAQGLPSGSLTLLGVSTPTLLPQLGLTLPDQPLWLDLGSASQLAVSISESLVFEFDLPTDPALESAQVHVQGVILQAGSLPAEVTNALLLTLADG